MEGIKDLITCPKSNLNGQVVNRCYTVQDLQIILGVGRKSIYSLLKRKEFHWFQIGHNQYRIPRNGFDEWLNRENSSST